MIYDFITSGGGAPQMKAGKTIHRFGVKNESIDLV